MLATQHGSGIVVLQEKSKKDILGSKVSILYYPPNYKTPNLLSRPQFKGFLLACPNTVVMHLNAKNTHFSAVVRDSRGSTSSDDGARSAKKKAKNAKKLSKIVELE